MIDFRTLDGALELFKQTDDFGTMNNVFITLRDTNRDGMKYGIAGGAAAGMAVALGTGIFVIKGNSDVLFNDNFDALLINQTEKGLGIIPMHNKKALSLSIKFENLEPALDEYVFIPFESISEIKVKDYSFLNKKTQKVKIKLNNKYTLHLLARKQEKEVPYQKENYARIMAQYGKK